MSNKEDRKQDDAAAEPIYKSRIIAKTESLPERVSEGDLELIEAVSGHIERYVGPIDTVEHEIESSYVHIDINHIAPTPNRPYHALVTTGMSEQPMDVEDVPDGEHFRYAELMMCLPPSWPLPKSLPAADKDYWPVMWLRFLARYPHQYGTWFWYGHSMPLASPDIRTGTDFVGVVLLDARVLPEHARRLELSKDKTIYFWGVYPVFAEEMDLKLRAGVEELERLFEKNDITELVDVRRKNVAKKRFWLF
jgi:hypothetical protein